MLSRSLLGRPCFASHLAAAHSSQHCLNNKLTCLSLYTPRFAVVRHHSHNHSHTHSHQHTQQPDNAPAQAVAITKVGVWSNIGLGTGKLVIGFASGSSALIADAFHSFSDLISDGVTLVALRYARRSPDHTHPYGYGRYETIGSLTVSIMLIAAALGIAEHSFHSMMTIMSTGGSITSASMGMAAMGMASLSIGVKEWLYRRTIQIGTECNSPVVIANAFHHRSDAASSVVALVGVGGAVLGFPIADPLGGFLVAGMIFRDGIRIAWDSIRELTDAHADEHCRLLSKVREVCTQHTNDDYGTIGNMRSRRMGHYFLIDMQLVVNPRISVSAAHLKSETLRRVIISEVPGVLDVLVHVDAEDSHDPWPLSQPQHRLPCDELSSQQHQQQQQPWTLQNLEHAICEQVCKANIACRVKSVMAHFLKDAVEVEVVISVHENQTVGQARIVADNVKDVVTSQLMGIHKATVLLSLGSCEEMNPVTSK